MPLRDHFRPPLDDLRHWEGMHGGWPMMIVTSLRRVLPPGYFAEPRVHSGQSAEIDVAAFADEAVWAPPGPTLTLATDLPAQDTYEVQVFDERRHCRLVAAVEIVSPGNKDRPGNRRAFVAKCLGMLRERVSVIIVDMVTTRTQNLYVELLEMLGEGSSPVEADPLYANACRYTKRGDEWSLETWENALTLAKPLPTLPLWLADNLAVPLELEKSYEENCAILGIS